VVYEQRPDVRLEEGDARAIVGGEGQVMRGEEGEGESETLEWHRGVFAGGVGISRGRVSGEPALLSGSRRCVNYGAHHRPSHEIQITNINHPNHVHPAACRLEGSCTGDVGEGGEPQFGAHSVQRLNLKQNETQAPNEAENQSPSACGSAL